MNKYKVLLKSYTTNSIGHPWIKFNLQSIIFRSSKLLIKSVQNKYGIARVYAAYLGPIYTWRTFTGVKLNNNGTKLSRPAIFWQCNQDIEPKLH